MAASGRRGLRWLVCEHAPRPRARACCVFSPVPCEGPSRAYPVCECVCVGSRRYGSDVSESEGHALVPQVSDEERACVWCMHPFTPWPVLDRELSAAEALSRRGLLALHDVPPTRPVCVSYGMGPADDGSSHSRPHALSLLRPTARLSRVRFPFVSRGVVCSAQCWLVCEHAPRPRARSCCVFSPVPCEGPSRAYPVCECVCGEPEVWERRI